MSAPAEAHVRTLHATPELQRWTTPERYPRGAYVQVRIFREDEPIAMAPIACGGLFEDRKVIVRVRVCGGDKPIRFYYAALHGRERLRVVYSRAN